MKISLNELTVMDKLVTEKFQKVSGFDTLTIHLTLLPFSIWQSLLKLC